MQLYPQEYSPYVWGGMLGPIGGGARLDGPKNII